MRFFSKILPALFAVVILSCAVFGFGITADADQSLANNTVSLTVGENIVSNYVIDCASYRQHGATTLRYTYNGSTDKNYVLKTKTVDLTAQGDTYAFSVYQAAAQIAEPTTVTVYNSEGTTLETFTYSAKEYCDAFINMTPEEISAYQKGERLQTVCKAVVAYGKAAQGLFTDYMNNNEGAVAINDSYASLGITNDISYTPASAVTKINTSNITFNTVSFICDSMARLRIYLTPASGYDIESAVPEVDLPEGAVFAPEYSAARPYIDINNIKPYSFDERITIAYPDGATLSVSVLDYAKGVLNSSAVSSQAKDLARTLINYNNTAKAYFHYNTHILEYVEPVSPTCLEAGNTGYYICSDCGEMFADAQGETAATLESVTVAALGHDYASVVTAPTCTAGGYTTYTCSRCNDSYTGDETAALGHDYTSVVTEPTCTQNGYTTHTCSRCGDSYTDSEVSALGHILGEPEFVWSQDYKSVTAVFHCGRTGCTDEITEYTTDIYSETTPATCMTDGTVTYIGTFANESMPSAITTITTQAALGHDYVSVVTAPTCTAGGYTTYTCSRCGDTYTGDETAALGHTAGEAVTENTVAATCTAAGSYDTVTYCTVCNAELSRETSTVAALGHNFGEWTVTTAPTCTAAGVETRTCSRCDASETQAVPATGHTAGEAVTENTVAATCTAAGSYDTVTYCTVCNAELSRETSTVAALGHDYQSTVTAATCTAGGYTTYTCSRCNDTYTGDETAALGHNWVAGTAVAPTHSADGYTPYTCSVCGATKQDNIVPALNIKVKLPNTASYLYRAGNGNNIALGNLFEIEDSTKNSINSSAVTVTFEKLAQSAAGTFTANTSDWTAATVKFTGTGVIRVTVKQSGYASAVLLLEIVSGNNLFEGATFGGATSSNVVLLGNVNVSSTKSINNGKTLYGNGFSVTDTRSSTSGTSGYINMSGGGTIDNAKIYGQVYSSAVTSGVSNENYSPGIWITGNANILNSYISECKYAVQVDGGNVLLENSTFDGGAIANICIAGANVTMKNCTTTASTRGGLNGLGVRVTSASAKISIEGTLVQYNWMKKSDLPSMYSSVLNSVYSDSTYAYNYNGTAYVNMGIFFITDASAITEQQARASISDSTGNNYGFIEKTASGLTGTLYTAKASMGSADMMSAPSYSETNCGQYATLPTHSFNYTKNDFTTDDKTYCTYNSTSGVTQISFEEDSSMNWDSSILTVTKYGSTIPYTVTMNNTDYTGQSIPFTAAGDYTVTYSYTDPYNYDKNGNAYSVTYTKTVPISVTVVEHGIEIYHPDFTYANIGGTTASKQVETTVSGAKRVYVMPDVSSTSSTIESKTVGGQTIYYPVVSVPASSSSGGSYSSGKMYYFAPAFKYINITDYDQSDQTTKTAKYTYNTSTQKWPHNVSSGSQPDTSYYYYTSTATSTNTNRPYGRSMNEQYYGYKYVSSQGGLCFSSNDIQKDNNANSQLVEFYYKGTDDVTYYYYIKYSFAAQTYSSGGCVAEGSLVTMADGTQKLVEDVKVGDMVKTWSFFNGCYEDRPIVANMYHGTKEWSVLDLEFSDGSDIEFIYDHGLFDADINNNVYINTGNVDYYVGHKFIKPDENGVNTEVELIGYTVTNKVTGAYAPLTEINNNCIINGLYTICSEENCHGLFEYFDIGEGMKYDEAKMQADIDKYGVYTYDDLSDCMSEEMFNAINAKYYKISAAKHGIDRNEIARIFNQYM